MAYEEVKVEDFNVLVDRNLWRDLGDEIRAGAHGHFCTRKEAFENLFVFTIWALISSDHVTLQFDLDRNLKSTDTGVFECTTRDKTGTPITCLVKVNSITKDKSGIKKIMFGCNTLPFLNDKVSFNYWIKANIK